jgi:hypothetical protein
VLSVGQYRDSGPTIAGVLVSLSGPTLVFALNAVSFVGIVVVLVWWLASTAESSTGIRPGSARNALAARGHARIWRSRRSVGHLDSCPMMPLRVSDAIQSAEGLCSAAAAQVAAGAPPLSGSPTQPSAVAMTAGHAAVEAAAAAMIARLQATGTKVSQASVSYQEHDARSAEALGEQVV